MKFYDFVTSYFGNFVRNNGVAFKSESLEFVMRRQIGFLILLMLSPSMANASSCGAQIDKVQAQVDARLDSVAGTDPGARESRAALLHHEPTPASIAAAERGLRGQHRIERALAALRRARKAEAHGDTRDCEAALSEARAAIAP